MKVWSCFATIGDHIAPDLRLKKTVGRLATYLQGYGDLLVRTNDWDPAVLGALPGRRGRHRRHRRDRQPRPRPSSSSTSPRSSPPSGSRRRRRARPSSASPPSGSQLDLGCDGVILHGASPTELAPVVDAVREGQRAERWRPTSSCTAADTAAGATRRWRRLLRAAGHEVYTPTLTGLGERSHLLRPGIDLDLHIHDVVARAATSRISAT